VAFSKASGLKIVNPLLAIVAFIQLVTMIMFTFFGESIPFEPAKNVHVIGGYVLLILVGMHIFLNWTWIKSTFFKKKRQ
jgi:hypothetical protein